ncbi:MAG TPA: hypothetical protein VGX25_13415 [Actinophytocola sp.]|uniref:hypothetical protein n=1 Tax=Actinophytocola sp. TaxID=1872138 RepID=UPI002DDD0253|nr:hypothetical protein [Actinophytocola sp.]HEV2780382.1 hypothetical protein [Actinophytocola sp.]
MIDQKMAVESVRRRGSRAIASAVSDLLEDLASYFFIALAVLCAAGLIAALLIWIGSWWVYGAFTVAVTVGLIAWLVRRRRLERTLKSTVDGGGVA